MDLCAVNNGLDFHLFDHIAPLASMKQIPLIVTEPECAELCAKYYPEVTTKLYPDLEFRYKEIADQFDGLVHCRFWEPHMKELFQSCYNKNMQLIFCPHGQSDKGYGVPLLAPYADQDVVLLYGDLLKEMLTDLNVWDSIQSHEYVGNYRLTYYRNHQERLSQSAKNEIFSHLNLKNKTLLYAPTWNDAVEATTFFKYCEKILKVFPSHWILILKLHPLLEQRNPALFYSLSALQQKRPNFILVDKFPFIYPILDTIDAYLGDYSSVGYDVLTFEKPMFFLPHPKLPQARLHSCGQVLDPSKNLFDQIDSKLKQAEAFKPIQKNLYQRAFSNHCPMT